MSEFQVVGNGEVELGRFSSVGAGAQIVFAKPGRVIIGDYCSIGPGVKFVCSGGDVFIGDWVTLHDNCLVLSGQGARIGAHCWFGQNCVIDGSGGLTIGTGVRVGMYSQIWSHVAAGEQIEGCTLYGQRPVIIENDVWLVGSCIVASGVTLGERTVALIASNITKSWPARSVIAGSPAALKPNLSFYREVGLDEKWTLLAGWLDEASSEIGVTVRAAASDQLNVQSNGDDHEVAFVKTIAQADSLRASNERLTVCCVEDKSYNKQLNDTERRVLKFLAGNKARFNVCQ
jgi:acetyltransferase-like isoleucine patch superfamily enzyme